MSTRKHKERIRRAEQALEGYQAETLRKFPGYEYRCHMPDTGTDEWLTDLVTDLLHLARSHGVDVNCLLRRAGDHFDWESWESSEEGGGTWMRDFFRP